MTYATDMAWERRTAPLLAESLQSQYGGRVQPASLQDDRFHGTDFFWNRNNKTYRLAARVRKAACGKAQFSTGLVGGLRTPKAAFLQYKDDCTIREDRPHSDQITELEKIRAGDWANLYAYAFSDGRSILHWSLFRMSRFNSEAPFTYMPGFGPGNSADTVTRIYHISGQPDGFLLALAAPCWGARGATITTNAIPTYQDQKRTVA